MILPVQLLLVLISIGCVLAHSITTLSIDWSHGSLASLGTISTGSNVEIAWDVSKNPNNLTFSVLLKQQDPISRGSVAWTLAAKGVPNNGSFLWSVDPAIQPVSGGKYYIRFQTGSSDDWDGGIGTVPPTPGGVYGLAGYFSIDSPSASTTTTNTAASPSTTTTTLSIDWSHGPFIELGTIAAGSDVKIVWNVLENFANLTLSVLLERKDPDQGVVVVSVIAPGGVPNNGSFLWSVDFSIKSCEGYFIRLQTGSSSDWDGGIGTSSPTPDDVYGLVGCFSIISSSTKSSGWTSSRSDFPATSISSHLPTPVYNESTPITSSTSRITSTTTVTSTPPFTSEPGEPTPSVCLPPTVTTTLFSSTLVVPPPLTVTVTAVPPPVTGAPPTVTVTATPPPDTATPPPVTAPSPTIVVTATPPDTAAPPTVTVTATPPPVTAAPPTVTVTDTPPPVTAAPPTVTVITTPPPITAVPPTVTVTAAPPTVTVTAAPPTVTVTATPAPVTAVPPTVTVTATPPTVTVTPPIITVTPPTVTATPPTVTVTPPTVTDTPPTVTATPPTITVTPPTITDTPPTVTVTPPTVTTTPPTVTVTPPTVTDTPSTVTVTPPTVTDTPPTVTVSPPTVTVTTTATPPSTTTSSSSPSTSTSAPAAQGTPAITSLQVDWSAPGPNSSLGLIMTGSPVNINWDPSRNSFNYPFAVLLKQGRGSEGGRLISIPEPSDVPNNGLYVWNVANTLPSGDDYYIRMQTGTSDDWDGGQDTSPPTSGDIYGTTGYFSFNSTTPAAAATVVATQFVTCCSSDSNAGVIAGSVIGGVIGLAFLLGALGYTFMPRPPLPGLGDDHIFGFLFPIPLPLALREKEGLGPAQLTLTLVPEGPPIDKTEVIAWQVFNIDSRKPLVEAKLPADRGFGSVKVEEDLDVIAGTRLASSSEYDFVPRGWVLGMEWGAGGISFKKPKKGPRKSRNHILFKNLSNVPRNVTIGSFHVDGEYPRFQPFLMVEDVKSGGEPFVTSHGLVLQVYLTYGVRVGQIMTEPLLAKPLLKPQDPFKDPPQDAPQDAPQEGIPVGTLEKRTTWEVRARGEEIYLKIRKE